MKALYKVISPSMTSTKGKVKKINRELWISVEVENEGNGYCTITPVSGSGSIRVRTDRVIVK